MLACMQIREAKTPCFVLPRPALSPVVRMHAEQQPDDREHPQAVKIFKGRLRLPPAVMSSPMHAAGPTDTSVAWRLPPRLGTNTIRNCGRVAGQLPEPGRF